MKFKPIFSIIAICVLCLFACLLGCDEQKSTSDGIQAAQQERILAEGTAQVGMPAIKNFRERKILKDIYELRDQAGLPTYTYIVAENTGKFILLGKSIGYGISAAVQFTNPQKLVTVNSHGGYDTIAMAQADPNGLFSPASTEGTWVLLVNPADATDVQATYIEPRVIVSRFPLPVN